MSFVFISLLRLLPISPISPSIRSLVTVATLSSLITEEILSPVSLNSGWVSLTTMSVDEGFRDTLEEMKATITSLSPSNKTKAGLSFADVKSVNGKGMRTTFPFNGI